MMLYKLSLKNIQKSFRDYAIYFFTLILGVSIFYVFNAIESQAVMMTVSESTRSIIELMTNMLSGVSVFVSFILGFLILYANRFLMKRRKKEFGIYLTLGMSKQKISWILFIETILIGLLSLVVGLGVGVFLSQWMSLLVVNLFEADMTNLQFVFSASACIKTLIYFGIIYVLVMLFNTINISKCKLIDLLHSEKKSEKISMKNPFVCIIIFLISAGMLSYAYYMVTIGVESVLTTVDKIFIPIAMGLVSTYGILWSLSGLLLKLIQKRKKIYWKGLNSFTLRQISSKINTTVFSMSMICIMLFVTICVLSSSLSIKNSMTANLKTLAPADIEFSKEMYLEEEMVKSHWLYTKEMIPDSRISLQETLKKLDYNIDDYLKDIVELKIYGTPSITLEDTLGETFDEAQSKFPMLNTSLKEDLIRISDYNKIARLFSLEEFTLKENEYIIISDFDSFVEIRNKGLEVNTPISIGNKKYYPKYQNCQNGFVFMSSNHINSGIIIVPDDAVEESMLKKEVLTANYKTSDENKKKEFESVVLSMEKHPYNKKTNLSATTRLSIYESSVGLGALVTFIGLYLGIIFLISSAAILALKELSESSDNKTRFQMLRKIGTDERLIKKALFRQILIFFLTPLILAIIHSIFGIIFCNYILESFGTKGLLPSIIMTSAFLIFIYGGYFLITYTCSKNMIKDGV